MELTPSEQSSCRHDDGGTVSKRKTYVATDGDSQKIHKSLDDPGVMGH